MAREWRCTYRLQLNAGFTFADAARIAPYLAELGISHVYLSPILQAAPGSAHVYDVADPTRLSRELGGEAVYRELCDALSAAGLGQLLDIVPNHMTTEVPANPWFRDVLQNGPASRYGAYFDLRRDAWPITLPVLADTLDEVLGSGDLKLARGEHGPELLYFDATFPLAPGSTPDSDDALRVINESPEKLRAVLARQHYRLACWRAFADEPPYRRFFTIQSLIGLRIENPAVFEARHKLELSLVDQGTVDGLRVDHIDGLRDPMTYLDRLHARLPDSPVVVEKIFGPAETLPRDWPVEGTTGYDALTLINGLFVRPEAESRLTKLYRDFTGEKRPYDDVLVEAKRFMLEDAFRGELRDLVDLLAPSCPDVPRDALHDALREYIIALPVYRTYVVPERNELSETDRRVIEASLSQAAWRSGCNPKAFEALRDVLLLERRGEPETDFVLRLQQLSGPVMAKGAEDTAFYRYHRLISLCEVGGDPGRWGTSLQQFHDYCSLRADGWPRSMIATATHDTKRGEDTRTRIDVLSETPEAWLQVVETWAGMNASLRRETGLDRGTEYLLYQSLVGAWPVDEARLQDFATKAVREAKLRTTWDDNNTQYEDGLRRFVAGLYANEAFLRDVEAFVASISRAGWLASLSQTLIKLTAPGVPDVYQGCELWDHSLVDPDNRRPVDYALRARLLEEAKSLDAASVIQRLDSGLPKLWLLRKTLELRRTEAAAFASTYGPLFAAGAKSEHVVAFVRGGRVLTIVPRWWHTLGDDWAGTTLLLPDGPWRDHLTGAVFEGGHNRTVSELLGDFPVALLVQTEEH